ncbi:MAG TPA: FHA domain-containing protein, partial [Candidatus Eremiobacteraeota bacterium]|nr:FHA domain-containing protein [Candidatus Eremiobacteraeota bacterium]
MKAKLILTRGKADREIFELENRNIKIGIYPDCDIIIQDDKFLSGHHASIIFSGTEFFIEDNNSTNGTFINNNKIDKYKLLSGDIINLGDTEFKFIHEAIYDYKDSRRITIGRNPKSDIFLNNVQVSWNHAIVTATEEKGFFIEDNRSSNGIYLNGEKIDKRKLKKGDIIEICDFKLLFDGTVIKYLCEEGKLRLDAVSLTRTVLEGKTILQDVSCSIYPCEFVAIVGTSGAGKSTLLKTLAGIYPPDKGKIFVNGTDFYQKLNFFRPQLGYVPQDDIVHEELTVYKALYYAASLRLPEDTKEKEINELIDNVLEQLELGERKYTQIKKLSGGQRKRVSIGVELLTKPNLFFLDEPTSGLD